MIRQQCEDESERERQRDTHPVRRAGMRVPATNRLRPRLRARRIASKILCDPFERERVIGRKPSNPRKSTDVDCHSRGSR